jgi:hypothetical protein
MIKYIFLVVLFFTQTSLAARFDIILREIIKYQEFEEEFCAQLDEQIGILAAKGSVDREILHNIRETFQVKKAGGDALIGELHKQAENIFNDSQKAVSLLEFLLEIRFTAFLAAVADSAENCSSSGIRLPVQDDSLLNRRRFDNNFKSSHTKEYHKVLIKNNVKSYQFIVLLIKKIFQSLSVEELSPEAIKLLRCSPQLADVLQGKTNDLGCIDHAGGYLKLMTYMNDFNCDQDFARVFIRQGKKSKTWEKNKKKYDIYWYKNHILVEKKLMPFLGLGMPDGDGIISYCTAYEHGDCQDELLELDYLKPKEPAPFIELPNFFDTVNFAQLDGDDDDMQMEHDITSNHDKVNDHVLAEPDSAEEKLLISKERKNITVPNTEKEFLMPAGIRKFHSLLPVSKYGIHALNDEQQDFINRLFSKDRFQKISYKQFEAFWRQLKGDIIASRGSSHKQLIGPDGDPLFGIYAHGKSQKYGKKTIKYFRAACYYIGCRPWR